MKTWWIRQTPGYDGDAYDTDPKTWAHDVDNRIGIQVIAFEPVRELVDRLKELGQAMPPNAVSMEIQKALKKFESVI